MFVFFGNVQFRRCQRSSVVGGRHRTEEKNRRTHHARTKHNNNNDNNNNNIIVAVVGVNRISRVGTGKTMARRRAPAVHELRGRRQIAPLVARILHDCRSGNVLRYKIYIYYYYYYFIVSSTVFRGRSPP